MRRFLPLAIVLGMAAGAAPGADNKYVAVGDSITVGSTWPVVSCEGCPMIFDCTDGCGASLQSDRDQCGFVRRLDTWLGDGNYVRNEGVGAESTAGAVSRFATEMTENCDTPGDCIAVILMHGTNDMSGSVGPETARDNLAFMIGDAKSRNIDTLLMTIIRKAYDPGNSKWSDYRDLILTLAASENVQVVDPYLPLCPTTTCYNDNYWVSPHSQCAGPGDPDLGHLDPDGYDVLTDLIKAVFPADAPDAPMPTSPAGDIGETTPEFVWLEVATARWYELDVDGSTTWWEAAAHCSSGTCTADPGVSLSEDSHSWRVRGRNLRGMGTWSADTGFEVWGLPGTPVSSSPAGAFFDSTPLDPPFGWEPYTWTEAAAATHYDLQVSNAGGPVLQQSFDVSICVASTCTASPGSGLAADSYTWTVQARNPALTGTASAPLAFDIFDQVPGEPTPTGPTGEHFETAPVYEWLEVAGATEYDLEVRDSANNLDAQATGLLASAVCAQGSCSFVEGTVLTGTDDYTLKVRGRNPIGDGPFSSVGVGFTILECADPSQRDLAELEPSPVTTTEVVKHCGPLTAAATPGDTYTIESSGDLTVHTRDGFAAYDGFTVLGKLTVRSP